MLGDYALHWKPWLVIHQGHSGRTCKAHKPVGSSGATGEIAISIFIGIRRARRKSLSLCVPLWSPSRRQCGSLRTCPWKSHGSHAPEKRRGQYQKRGLNAELDGQRGLMEFAGDATLMYYLMAEAQEGKNAFLEKRDPDFDQFTKFPG